jgi:hypothetical protein
MLRDWGLSAAVYGEDAKGNKEYLTTLPITKFVDGELRGLYGDKDEVIDAYFPPSEADESAAAEATSTTNAAATDAAIRSGDQRNRFLDLHASIIGRLGPKSKRHADGGIPRPGLSRQQPAELAAEPVRVPDHVHGAAPAAQLPRRR